MMKEVPKGPGVAQGLPSSNGLMVIVGTSGSLWFSPLRHKVKGRVVGAAHTCKGP